MHRFDTPPGSISAPAPAEEDPILADLIEELTGQLQSGGEVDANALIREHPEYADQLRELLPALQALAQAGAAPAWSVQATADGATPPLVEAVVPSTAKDFVATPSALPAALDVPVLLDDFHLLREVGRGGMGVVYEATQLSLGRRVALKVLPFASSLHPRQVQRFKNEAMAAAGLHHGHIVPVYAVGYDRGVHYYAMQLLNGRTLAEVIGERRQFRDEETRRQGEGETGRQGDKEMGPSVSLSPCLPVSLTPTEAARLILQAAEALEYAHQGGVIHRDIKPANLMLDDRGWLWVTDFGLACCQGQPGLTGTGEQPGTLRYMSPEQVLGSRAVFDHRTDVYALGVTLYELLTLEPAWPGTTHQELLAQITSGEPCPPRSLDRSIPVDLETIVLKAMARETGDRYETAQAFADDLRRFLEDRPILARRPSLVERGKRWLRRHRTVAYAATAVMAVAFAGLAVSTFLLARQLDAEKAHAKEMRKLYDEMVADVAEMWLSRQSHLESAELAKLQKVLAFYEKQMQQTGRDPDVQLGTALAARRVGDIRQKFGEDDEAETAYMRADELLQKLTASHPERADARAERAVVLNHRGNLLRRSGRLVEAREAYQQGRDAFAELVHIDPDEPAHRDGLAGSYINLGMVEHNLGRTQQAEAAYRAAQPLLRRLMVEYPRTPSYREHMAGLCHNFGSLLLHLKRLPEAEKFHQAALTLWKQLVKEWPSTPLYLEGEAKSVHHLADLRKALGRPLEAEQGYQEAIRQRARLVENFPRVPAYRQELATSRYALGLLLAELGRLREAEQIQRQAFRARNELASAYPDVPQIQHELSFSHRAFGRLLAATARTAQAQAAYHQAVALLERLVKAQPSVPAYSDDLRRFRDEAAALLRSGTTPSPAKGERIQP
jgi:serine/threonine protein kinase/tetratricopeptide (TPR) repeat protein